MSSGKYTSMPPLDRNQYRAMIWKSPSEMITTACTISGKAWKMITGSLNSAMAGGSRISFARIRSKMARRNSHLKARAIRNRFQSSILLARRFSPPKTRSLQNRWYLAQCSLMKKWIWRRSSKATKARIHAPDRAVCISASLNGRMGSLAMVPHTRAANPPRSRNRNFTRSHQGSGFRVARSSSRSRPLYSGGGPGPRSWSGQAQPDCGPLELMSSLLHGPRLHYLIYRPFVIQVTVSLAADHEQIQQARLGIDQPRLVHRVERGPQSDVEHDPVAVDPTFQDQVGVLQQLHARRILGLKLIQGEDTVSDRPEREGILLLFAQLPHLSEPLWIGRTSAEEVSERGFGARVERHHPDRGLGRGFPLR